MDFQLLDNLCQTFRRRLRALLVQSGLCRMLLVGLVVLPVLFALDWWLHLAPIWRFALLVGYLAVLGSTAWWTLIAPMKRAWRNEEILSHLDTVLPANERTLLELYELICGEGVEEA